VQSAEASVDESLTKIVLEFCTELSTVLLKKTSI